MGAVSIEKIRSVENPLRLKVSRSEIQLRREPAGSRYETNGGKSTHFSDTEMNNLLLSRMNLPGKYFLKRLILIKPSKYPNFQ